jgi:endonuclease/exonuclease/phosphatase family metal-dependent hydrolase
VVLCGDFNAVPTADEIRLLTGESPPPLQGLVFNDAWAAVGAGPGYTWDATNPHLADAYWPRRRLDYVFVSWPRPKPIGNPVAATLIGTEPVDGVVPSDHYGLQVDLTD